MDTENIDSFFCAKFRQAAFKHVKKVVKSCGLQGVSCPLEKSPMPRRNASLEQNGFERSDVEKCGPLSELASKILHISVDKGIFITYRRHPCVVVWWETIMQILNTIQFE